MTSQLHERTALVLGATGGIGGETMRQLAAAGWRVRAMARGTLPSDASGVEWVSGDAMRPADVRGAAAGCAVIVHAVNPLAYRNWSGLVLPMMDSTIAAAEAVGATIVLPGTVYNFGPDAFPLLREDDAQQPTTRKGAIRVEMERRLEAAASRGQARVLIVRAGDFFGASARNSWFAQGLVRAGSPVRTVRVPNEPDVGHQWSYLPDAAASIVALLERRATLPAFARFHLAGHWDPDGRAMAESIARVVAWRTDRTPRIARFPWALVSLVAPFVETLREMREMRYLWRTPVRLDGARVAEVLGREPHTPLDEAVAATLEGLGCVGASGGRVTAAAATRHRPA